MVINYPVFVKDKDNWMYMIDSELEINNLEAIDIENKEYTGWDAMGLPVHFYLDNENIKIKYTSEMPQLEELRKTILNYAKIARPKEPFTQSYPGSMVELFAAVEQHIQDTSFIRKIKKFIKKLSN